MHSGIYVFGDSPPHYLCDEIKKSLGKSSSFPKSLLTTREKYPIKTEKPNSMVEPEFLIKVQVTWM